MKKPPADGEVFVPKELVRIVDSKIREYQSKIELKKERLLRLEDELDGCIHLLTYYQGRKEQLLRGEL